MKTIIVVFFLSFSILLSNEPINIKLKLTNGQGLSQTQLNNKMSFGLHKDATQNIDTDLGESEIPPCVGAFTCSSFYNFIPENEETIFQYIDIKPFPAAIEDSVVFTFRFFDMIDSVVIEWENFPAQIYFAKMRSSYLSLHWNDIDMKTQNRVMVNNPAVTDFKIVLKYNSNSGIEDDLINKSIVYPNPSTGKINIKDENIKNIKVYNSLGNIVYESTGNSNAIQLNFLPDGVYYVNILDSENKIHSETLLLVK